MSGPVVNLDSLELTDHRHGDRYAARFATVASRLGARQLGARLVVVPAGKRAWPYHCHHANEEMFLVLSGSGTLRFAGEVHPLRAGDVVVCPPGGPETAHQIINDSGEELRYLAISTMREPDVMEYPDSGKVGVFAGAAPGGDASERRVALFVPGDAGVDYWAGEQ